MPVPPCRLWQQKKEDSDKKQRIPRRATNEPIPVSFAQQRLLVLDHAFAAISDDDGRFVIADVPTAEVGLAAWSDDVTGAPIHARIIVESEAR